MKRKKTAPRELWALYDAKGVLFGSYLTEQEAHDDAWGPIFRPRYRVCQYTKFKTRSHKARA
jgi:hypothetical protein